MAHRKLAGLLALILAAGALAGCSSGKEKVQETAPSAAETAAAQETEQSVSDESVISGEFSNDTGIDEITYIQDTGVTSLSPWDVRMLTPGIAYELYEMLFGVDDTGEFYPVLADATKGNYMPGMDHEAGSGDYTVYIYDYITDSEGHKITANDVKFSLDMSRDAGYESGWGKFESEEVVDDTTLILHCSEELSMMGELQNIICRCFIVSEEAYNNSQNGFSTEAVGTGPYTLESFTPSVEMTVKKRDGYWQTNDELRQQIQQANVDKITMTMINESTQKIIGLETGEIDLAEKFNSDGWDQLVTDGYDAQFKALFKQSNMIVYAYCNNSPESICSNVSLRKAILKAIDNDGLAAFVRDGQVGVKALGNSFYPDYDPAWEGKFDLYQPADAAEIKSLLDAAGYRGEQIELVTASFCGQYAEVIQGQLQEYGINVNLNILDGGTLNATQADPKQWDIIYGYMAADDYVVNYWSHLLDAAGRSTGMTENFIDDDKLQELLHTTMISETHTPENLEAFLQYVDDNAYAKGLCTGQSITVYPEYVKQIFVTDKGYIVPGACSYSK